MENTAPLEIIASGQVEVWIAALATAKPDVDETPTGWSKVGTYGNLNYNSDGVTIAHQQDIERFRALGDVGTRKVARTGESLMLRLIMWDLTLEQYALALNHNAITTTAASSGVPGKKKIGLSRGSAVATRSLLFRAPSPYMTDGVMQYYLPVAAQVGNPEAVYRPNEPAGLALEWEALVDPNAASVYERFGYIEAQTAVAS